MKRLIRFLFPWFYRRWERLQARVSSLEIAVDSLIVSPRYEPSESPAFNGQQHRCAIFRQLLETFPFEAILETGTHIGNTTGYMASVSRLPVYSAELTRRYYHLARVRLQDFPSITLRLLDSRDFLQEMAQSPVGQQFVFAYLDAHWYDDLPLSRELGLVADHWRDFVIMVDDFAVPGDSGYGYDDYGRGKTLSLRDVSPRLRELDLLAFFPDAPSSTETGSRRGCVVLARRGLIAERLRTIPSLREVTTS